eukprot:scaffold9118_cov112-Isochrysis_galbana.AAC.1
MRASGESLRFTGAKAQVLCFVLCRCRGLEGSQPSSQSPARAAALNTLPRARARKPPVEPRAKAIEPESAGIHKA